MSLRRRLTFAAGGAVFVAVAIASLVIYVDVKSRLHDQLEVSLAQSAQGVATKWHLGQKALPPNLPSGKEGVVGKLGPEASGASGSLFGNGGSGYFQVIANVGKVVNTASARIGKSAIPGSVGPANRFVALVGTDVSVAKGLEPPYYRDIHYRGETLLMYTMPLGLSREGLVRTALPVAQADTTLTHIRWLLLALTLGGALVAALLGWLAANAVLRPVSTLAGAVRDVRATRALDQRIPVSGRDELASLAADFNGMLEALDESRQVQQQLIADASHELRTPLTAHRANLELLARSDLPPEQRRRVLAGAVRTMEKLSALVGDLIEAARDGRSVDAREPLAFDTLVAGSIERAEYRATDVRFESRLESHLLVGARTRLERAVDNVLDNAIKWSPPGGTVHIRLTDGWLTVRDEGPGIADGDLPHVFDRFYRSAAARALPGSGLGLAIVKQTVEDHRGAVTITNVAHGGALVTLRFDADADGD